MFLSGHVFRRSSPGSFLRFPGNSHSLQDEHFARRAAAHRLLSSRRWASEFIWKKERYSRRSLPGGQGLTFILLNYRPPDLNMRPARSSRRGQLLLLLLLVPERGRSHRQRFASDIVETLSRINPATGGCVKGTWHYVTDSKRHTHKLPSRVGAGCRRNRGDDETLLNWI